MHVGIKQLIDDGWPVTEETIRDYFGTEKLNIEYSKLRQLLLDVSAFIYFRNGHHFF